jgi:hypothetical protein
MRDRRERWPFALSAISNHYLRTAVPRERGRFVRLICPFDLSVAICFSWLVCFLFAAFDLSV